MDTHERIEEQLYVVRLHIARTYVDVLRTVLELADINMPSWELADQGRAMFESYFPSRTEAARFEKQLAGWLDEIAADSAWEIVTDEAEACDWQVEWKKFFHIKRISPHIVICPPWETFTAAPQDIVISIEPGMSFGTGQHGTTSACLRFLDALSPLYRGASVLDLGCGSGVLSIAAAKLGFDPVTALDNDPDAVAAARQNCAANGCERVSVHHMDAAAAARRDTSDVVVANILAEVLVRLASDIAACVAPAPRGRLILAGILHDQFDEIGRAYGAQGFTLLRSDSQDEWTSGLFARTPTSRPS